MVTDHSSATRVVVRWDRSGGGVVVRWDHSGGGVVVVKIVHSAATSPVDLQCYQRFLDEVRRVR